MTISLKKLILLVIAFLLLLAISAYDYVSYADTLDFSVTTVIPDNQIDKDRTYFDLLMEPGAEQTLSVVLRNNSEKDIVISARICGAITNINGVVEYGRDDVEPDKTLRHNMKDLVVCDKRINIPKKGDYTLKLNAKMPAEEFDGVLAGGITFQQETSESEDVPNNGGGMTIKNEYAYVVAILLRQNLNEIKPNLVMNSVSPGQVNARNVINANIQNTEAMYMNKVKIDASAARKGSDTVYESHTENMQMAPNSNFDYPIRLEGRRMEAGDYTLTLTVYSMGEVWTFSREFTVSGEEAKRLNESDVSVEPEKGIPQWLLFLIIGVGILMLLVLIFLIILLTRRKKY